MTGSPDQTLPPADAPASTPLLRQIEWAQFALVTQQVRSGTYAGAAVIMLALLLAPHVANTHMLAGIALLRMALFVEANMLARTLQQEIARGSPSIAFQRRLIGNVGLSNLVWGALTWPLVIGSSVSFMAFLLAIIALFSICLSIVSASFHPKTLIASTLGGCLGLAPKIHALTGTVGLLLPLGFLIYCVTIFYFARVVGRQARGGIVLDIRRRRIAARLNQTNMALERALTVANRLADQDTLTRLRNRRAFEQALHRFAGDWADRDCFVMLIDVDHFKRINDRYGHAMGDGVLVALGTTLTQWEIEEDGRMTGRWGGEEFIVLAALDRTERPGEVADDLRARIEELTDGLHWPGRIDLSASIGCAQLHEPAQFDAALRRADQALYAAKKAGRNCWKLAA
ncbi:GGDEF domain-containing protein [Novosphingobium sp. B 225]|uniref:GGDEF domain-containing protein n=1 Tax=Novosphingobium sp. B 225 TaxID=1961849 RepID=UPI000B4B0B65|nr:GGDEF domain-containing protein [Novosphingobium sp. B 225]